MTPKHVTVVEVGPRDGLQNERVPVATADKIELVNRLSAAHLPVIEVSAFVSPTWVPQMADAEAVCAGIERRPATRYAALAPNMRGLDRALAAGVTEIGIFAAASAICGTHFGLTNAETSMTGRCAALRRLTSSILSAVATGTRSF